jgi:hypothetical protein
MRHGGRFYCYDGWNISVVWGRAVYCHPRRDNILIYDEVEAGFPSSYESAIIEYAEDSEQYMQTVYPYVPIEVLLEAFKKHGGVKYFKSYDDESIVI